MTIHEAIKLAETILSDTLPAHVQQGCVCYDQRRHVCAAIRAGVSVIVAGQKHYVCLCKCHDQYDEGLVLV